MNNIKVAIIGCGKQAPKHISGLRKISGVSMVLADLNPEFSRKLGEDEGIDYVESVEEIFANESIEAVNICTPTPSHAPLIRKAIESGKHFLCEKPLTDNLDEAFEIKKVLDASGLIGMVGYIYRFAPIFEHGNSLLKDISDSNKSMVLGELHVANFRLGGRGSHQLWKHTKNLGGGAINEMLVHMVDLAIWYFGEMDEVTVLACDLLRPHRAIQGIMQDVDAEDYVLVRMRSKTGIDIFCQADLTTPAFTQYTEIQGEHGTFAGSIQPHMPSYLFLEREVAGYKKGNNEFKFGDRNLFEAMMADYIQSINSGNQPSRSTISDSILLTQTMNKIKSEIN